MSSTRVVSLGAVVGFLLGVLGAVSPSTVHAAWVNRHPIPGRRRSPRPSSQRYGWHAPSSNPHLRLAGGHLAGPRPGPRSCAGSRPGREPPGAGRELPRQRQRHRPVAAELHQPGRRKVIVKQISTTHRPEYRLGPPCPSSGQGRPPRLWRKRRSLQHRLRESHQHARRHCDAADVAPSGSSPAVKA